MGKKKEKPINLNELEEEEKMKYEIAEELGLLDRVLAQGWKSLTSKETGRIGGLVTKRRRTQENGTAQTEGKRSKNRKQKGLILTKPLIFDKMLRMGSMVG